MSITLLSIGKIKSGPEKSLIDEYVKRLRWSLKIKELPQSNHSSAAARKAEEAEKILSHIDDSHAVIALDERGDLPNTQKFADMVCQKLDNAQTIIFVIGGADGLDETIRTRANHIIGFGAMTWPHKLVRVMLVEQLYRAWSLSQGHPYHRE